MDELAETMKVKMATADNRAYLAPCLRHSAQIPLRETSDTLGTLYEISIQRNKHG
jgi:hypothetical protein